MFSRLHGGHAFAIPGCKLHGQGGANKEYAFEIRAANIRYGPGVTREVGMDLANLKVRKVCVMTDTNVASLPGMKLILESLQQNNVKYEVYDKVLVEPLESRVKDAIAFAKRGQFDSFIAFGGGSVMDTCKAANLYASKPEADFFDFVNTPIGKGLPVQHKVFPLIAIPTTSGTGSESTAVSVFDYEKLRVKTVLGGPPLRPTLALIDPDNTLTMPKRLVVNTGFDILCHSIESLTCVAYNERTPRASNPIDRPTFQGCNPISDVWSREALRIMKKYFKRSVSNADDIEARSMMHMASNFAGNGFGSAGVHICHSMGHVIGAKDTGYNCDGYKVEHPIVPHGLAIILTAPAVFKFTAPSCPERHIDAAELLGADVTGVKREDAGKVLADTLLCYMQDFGIDNGLSAVGFKRDDIPNLVEGTMTQGRILELSARVPVQEDLTNLYEQMFTIY
jgi:hydroxyacid-oxoacid transhydrogenase